MKFTSFLPAASRDKQTAFSRRVRAWRLHRRTDLTIAELANGHKDEDGTQLSPGINPANLRGGSHLFFNRLLPDRGGTTTRAH